MSCYYHEGRESVSKCARCGIQLCRECEENALFRTENGKGQALCLRCSKNDAEAIITHKEKWLKRSLYVIIIAGFFMLGAIYYYLSLDIKLVACCALAALVMKLIGHGTDPGSIEDQVFRGTMKANDTLTYMIGSIIGYTIAAPIVYCFYVYGYIKTKKELKQDRLNLEIVNAAIAEHDAISQ